MKSLATVLGIALLLGIAAAQPVEAGLIGAQYTDQYLNPDTSTVVSSTGPFTVPDAGHLSGDGLDTHVTNTQITSLCTAFCTFAAATFNGERFIFSGVTILDATLIGQEGIVTFTPDSVLVNYAGESFDAGLGSFIDVTAVSAVPEPASLAVFAPALLGLGFLARRKRVAS